MELPIYFKIKCLIEKKYCEGKKFFFLKKVLKFNVLFIEA